MVTDKVQKMRISLMELDSDVGVNERSFDKENFVIRCSANFNFEGLASSEPDIYEEENFVVVLDKIFANLLDVKPLTDTDCYVGIWIMYDGETYEDSVPLQVLKAYGLHSSEDASAIYELVKMMLPE